MSFKEYQTEDRELMYFIFQTYLKITGTLDYALKVSYNEDTGEIKIQTRK